MRYVVTIAIIYLLLGCSQTNRRSGPLQQDQNKPVTGKQVRSDLKRFYDQYDVNGMIIITDSAGKQSTVYNPQLLDKAVPPASTFNIILTLIGLEEGHLKNETSALTRGDIKYTSSFPGDTMTLEEGFTNNRDWFFIRLSTLIGEQKMQAWLNRLGYGNKSIHGEANRFWINGDLAVTPAEQLQFIKNFYYQRYPFSQRSYSIVKKLLWQKNDKELKIYGKRGSNKIEKEHKYTGWFIGYIESPGNVYFFTNYIESSNLSHPTLVDAQKQVAYNVFDAVFNKK